MSEYLVIEDLERKQDRWSEERDDKNRVLRPARPARDDRTIKVRLDRQYTAKLLLPSDQATGADRQQNIAQACSRVALGEEVAPRMRVVEYEEQVTEAKEASVTPEEKDEKGKVTKPEGFIPAREERVEHIFTLRLDGRDLVKTSLSDNEFRQADWKATLASKVAAVESFVR